MFVFPLVSWEYSRGKGRPMIDMMSPRLIYTLVIALS